jgi:gluconate 2-dehydrogenase gamma chain
MDRRTSLAALSALAGHALFSGVLEAWAQTAPGAWRPRALDAAGGGQLAALVDAILPDTDTPGARRAGVHVFVDLVVAECLPTAERQAFVSGLAALNASCRTAHQADLGAAPPAAVAELLRTAEASRSPFVKSLKSLTVLGYATSQPGATQALAYDPSPGGYRGCVDLAPGQRTWAER